MKKWALLILVGLLVFPAVASARTRRAPDFSTSYVPPASICPSVQAFTVQDDVGIPAGKLAKWERAIAAATRQVSSYWHTPCAQFAPSGGWMIYLTKKEMAACSDPSDGETAGCHIWPSAMQEPDGSYEMMSAPWANASLQDSDAFDSLSVVMSHEVIETVTDPDGLWDPIPGRDSPSLEICDIFYDSDYKLDGVDISNWTLPYFYMHPFGNGRESFAGARA